ncbi:MAG TPA: HD domain-containing protein [Candidatus Limnocylindrales bacterium]|nr:HD domain-containing protein [Candidatus Limnocylindrales bacterium]
MGGSLRDLLADRPVHDWDLATSALPEQTRSLFPGSVYENEFGTVDVDSGGDGIGIVQVTTFRADHDYADFRRPHRVEFGESIERDLARRDFTVNAIAWGVEPGGAPRLVDPYGGRDDLATGVLRAVGDAPTRFREDALRMVRAVRLAAALELTIEPDTLAAIGREAELVRHLSGERIAQELTRILETPRPSVALRLLEDSGLLAVLWPDLAAQRGVPQNKIVGEDLWDHTLRSVDAASTPRIRLAALLHDLGKPATMADGRFVGHEIVGADLARRFLDDLRWPHAERDRIVRLIRQHMFGYVPTWSDAAVRRFIAKVGRDLLEDLFLLREADNVGSGRPPEPDGLAELRRRVEAQLSAGVALDRRGLAVDGADLIRELGLPPGPLIGRILDRLLERAIADPADNTRERLLRVARSIAAQGPTA